MQLTQEFREKVRAAVLQARDNFGGSDADFAKKLGIGSSIYSRLKNGETERIVADGIWLTWGREFEVSLKHNNWVAVRTQVYIEIEDNLNFCQQHSRSMVFVDACGIGKSFCAKHITKSMKNAFYHDCSQSKTRQQFVRQLAKKVGVDNQGKYIDVKNNLKYYINQMDSPLIVLDEAGDLEYNAFLEVKELWNATEGNCGWYMIGADGLQAKITKGIDNKKVGYREIFSRFSDEYISIVPTGIADRTDFYRQLIGDVANANLKNKSKLNGMINQCIKKEATLRYLDTLLKIEAHG